MSLLMMIASMLTISLFWWFVIAVVFYLANGVWIFSHHDDTKRGSK